MLILTCQIFFILSKKEVIFQLPPFRLFKSGKFYLPHLHLGPQLPCAHWQTPLTQQSPAQLHLPSLQQPPLTQTHVFCKQQLFVPANALPPIASIAVTIVKI